MKEIMIINLMRLGDLVQTTPLLRAVRREHPTARITLVVQDVFQEVAELMPGYDRLVVLDFLRLAPLVDQEGQNLLAAYDYLATITATLKNPRSDLVINLTPNRLGAILTRLVAGPEVRGLTMTADRQFRSQPAWMAYMLCAAKHYRFNPFNIVDQFTRGGGFRPQGEGVALKPPATVLDQVDRHLAALGRDPSTWLIGLQPGASAVLRQWPPESFVTLARLLLETHSCHFLLLGTEKERHLGEFIQARLPVGVTTSLMGQTRIADLAAYLARLQLLITNDTGTMHVACGVGTPVLGLFLATARVHDTGPTGRGHLALQPRLDCYPCQNTGVCTSLRCHQALDPALVAHLAQHRLQGQPLTQIDDNPFWENVDVFVSDYDDQGYQVYYPLICRPLDPAYFWNLVMRLGWRWLLDGSPEPLRLVVQQGMEFIRRYFQPPINRLRALQREQALQELIQLAQQGLKRTGQILPLGVDADRHLARIKTLGERLVQIDTAIVRLGHIFPEIASLVEMFQLAQTYLEGSDLIPLTRQTRELYGQLYRQGKIFLKILSLCDCQWNDSDLRRDHPLPSSASWLTGAETNFAAPNSF